MRNIRAAAFEGIAEITHRLRYVGTFAFGLEIEQLTDEKKDMLASFLRRNEFLDLSEKKMSAYFIIVLYCRESYRRSYLGYHLARFSGPTAPKYRLAETSMRSMTVSSGSSS